MKKILSLILVLAMLLGMTSIAAFADSVVTGISITPTSVTVFKDKTGEVSSTITLEGGGTPDSSVYDEVAWSMEDDKENVATIPASSTGRGVTVTGVGEGTAKLTAKIGEHSAVCTVKVYDASKYALELTADNYALKKGGSTAKVTAELTYTGTMGDGAATVTFSSGDTTVATVNSSGVITSKGVGTATITATAKVGGVEVASDDIEISVYDLALSYEVENYGSRDIDDDDLIDDIEKEILSQEDDNVDIKTVKVAFSKNDFGTLKAGSTTVSGSTTVGTAGLSFQADKYAIGKAEYSFEATTDAATPKTYTGTLTFDIQPYEDIDEEVSATFSKNPFYLDVPSGLDYMKIVSSEADFEGVFSKTTSGMKADDKFLFDPTDYSTKISGGKLELYVVGLDGDYASAGKITITGLDADIFYLGEVDSETTFDADDFEDLYEDIFAETLSDTSTAYVEFEEATFTYSKNNNYKLYNDGSDMTTTKLKTVALKDLDSVSVEPLKSGEYIIPVKLTGKYYSSSTATKSTSKSYEAAIKVSALEGDVEYTATAGSTFYLDELDFSSYYIDATKSSSARLNYIVLKDTDVKYASISVPKSSTLASYEYYDGQKLYTELQAGTRDLLIEDTKVTVAKTVANGTKIYIPFTASGNKSTKSGYIEITVGAKAPTYTFSDVLSGSWYYNPVQWACANEITKGTSSTTFSPNLGCTRAQAVTFLYRAYLAAGGTKYSSTTTGFTDVDKTKHADYLTAIAWAKANGVTSGTSATTFGPDKVCTRAQIVTFIYNYVSKVEGRSVVTYGANPFKDVKPTGAHKAYADAIQWAVDKKVTSGETSTTFAPDKTCTRAHIVTFLYNYFN